MILSDIDIAYALTDPNIDRRLVLTPLISSRHQFGPSSVDVRLGTDFAVLDSGNLSHVDTREGRDELKLKIQKYTRRVRLKPGDVFHLHPGDFALACTLEFLRLPVHIAARIECRSSWGRIGLLVHATAGYVDPGFSGVITFELVNAGKLPLALKPGLRIGQICFIQMSSASRLPYGFKDRNKYQGSLTVQPTKIYSDPEVGD